MPSRIGMISLIVGGTMAVPLALQGQDKWASADLATVRLEPESFSAAPSDVRRELARRHCTIPQPFDATTPANLVSGRFLSATREDWAAICSVDRVSTILVFVAGQADSVMELASQPDRTYLQSIGDGRIGFSRLITRRAAPRASVLQREGCPRASAHDGIDDAFLEKSSTFYYWCESRWLIVAGRDS